MKSIALKFFSIGLLSLALIIGPIFYYWYKRGSERVWCQYNLSKMHNQIYTSASFKGIYPGVTIPDGTYSLLNLGGDYDKWQVCRAGGTYTFWSDDKYTLKEPNVRCSLADTKGHVHTVMRRIDAEQEDGDSRGDQ